MNDLEWTEPPPKEQPLRVLTNQLCSRPGEWARISKDEPAMTIFPWWAPLRNDDRFELEIRRTDPPPRPIFGGTVDIYARYVGT